MVSGVGVLAVAEAPCATALMEAADEAALCFASSSGPGIWAPLAVGGSLSACGVAWVTVCAGKLEGASAGTGVEVLVGSVVAVGTDVLVGTSVGSCS